MKRGRRRRCWWLSGLVLSALCGGAFAEQADVAPTAAAPEASAADAGLIEETRRDPFWPIGYTPPPPEAAEEQVVQVRGLEWPELVVSGRIRGPDGAFRILVSGHGPAKEGDLVSVRRQDHWFHWRILNIYARGERIVRLGITRDREPDKAWLRARESSPDYQEETTP